MEKSDFFIILAIVLMIVVGALVLIYFKSEGASCMIDAKTYYEAAQNTTCFCSNEILKP